jgi:hypothetical protein
MYIRQERDEAASRAGSGQCHVHNKRDTEKYAKMIGSKLAKFANWCLQEDNVLCNDGISHQTEADAIKVGPGLWLPCCVRKSQQHQHRNHHAREGEARHDMGSEGQLMSIGERL